jgi:hypothetical protein
MSARKVTAMTSIGGQLVPKTRQIRPGHAIVMSFAAGAALIAASALLATVPAVAPAASGGDAIVADPRASGAPAPVLSLGYVEFDWSAAHDIPGFGPLPAGDSGAAAL